MESKTEATWPDLAEGLYGFLTGRGATIQYELDDLEIKVPKSSASDAPRASWHLNGTVRISTTETAG